MDFCLTEEQQLIRSMIQEFAKQEVAPIAEEIDRLGKFPEQTVKRLAELELTGMPYPRKYGGAEADYVSYAIVIEELSRACASTGVILALQTLSASPIYQFGTEMQKEKWLPLLTQCKKLGAFALTEAGAGTDAGSIKTTAVLDGDEYLLNGSKTFITTGDMAGIFIVFAVTEQGKGTKGISAFIVESNTPGFSIGKHEDKMGMRGSHTTELFFKDCRIPRSNILGREGEGFKIAMVALDGGRISIAAQAVGIAQACLDESIRYSKERIQFGRPIAANQAIQWMIADMATDVEAARLLTYNAAYHKGQGRAVSLESAMAKVFASETAMKHAVKAIQIQGGYGYIRGAKVERLLRDAKITEIYEGTSEAQRMIISGNLLR